MKKYKFKIIILALLLIGLLAGIYSLNRSVKKAYDYSNYYIEVTTTKNSIETISKDKEVTNKELSLSLLKNTNEDVVGVLEFTDRTIYEPIVQAPDNEYYVRKNIERKYSAAGIPFIACEGNINSKNVVIYGHSSTLDNIIFTPLMNYLDYNYYKSNSTFKFILEDDVRTYQIFSIMNIDLNNLDDSLEFSNTTWRSNLDFEQFINNSINSSLYNTNIKVKEDDQIMTLVTCDTRDNNKRIVVLGKLLSND